MQKLTASGILCNGRCRVPADHQRFRSERPRTDNRLQLPWHLILPAVVGKGQRQTPPIRVSWPPRRVLQRPPEPE